jgi:UDP-2,3-diacylglucosamine hydrolase
MKNKVYFISDAHLGSWAIEHSRTHERRLVSFLDKIKGDAAAIYMLGDMFDFWYEYRYAVPKGFTRFLGKISELTDSGVEVHFFPGNHDLWCKDYFEKECGMIIHREPLLTEINGREFFLAHGDEFAGESNFAVLRAIFHSPLLQRLFSWFVHPRWAMNFGLGWASHSMRKHKLNGDIPFRGAENEPCMRFAHRYLEKHQTVDYFIFGHRHCDADVALGESSRCIILGDWISEFTYVEYDGKELAIKKFVEGEK